MLIWQEGLAFAPEIQPLLVLPGVTRDVNPQRLYDYLRGGLANYGAENMFARVNQLPAAHYMEVSLDNPQAASPVRYWDIDLKKWVELSFEDAAKQEEIRLIGRV